ncbi:SRPBCC domain-containing protein [Compostibacter hankyongensis]|uniref:SRPBCC domain-containing protein n=1 Tax=Compostibacter hankyongensis TaxID=1007089 RepID=A0ABP8FHE3_9BACT
MNSNLQFGFSVNKEEKAIAIKREFAAELPVVWDAFTKSEILDQWWGPKPWKARTKTMDFREGGTWHYAMVGPNGEEHWAVMNYHAIDERKNFTGQDGFADEQGNVNKDMPQSNWRVSFTGKGDKTLVEFQLTFDDLDQLEGLIKMGFKEGLTIAMEGLDDVLANRQ